MYGRKISLEENAQTLQNELSSYRNQQLPTPDIGLKVEEKEPSAQKQTIDEFYSNLEEDRKKSAEYIKLIELRQRQLREQRDVNELHKLLVPQNSQIAIDTIIQRLQLIEGDLSSDEVRVNDSAADCRMTSSWKECYLFMIRDLRYKMNELQEIYRREFTTEQNKWSEERSTYIAKLHEVTSLQEAAKKDYQQSVETLRTFYESQVHEHNNRAMNSNSCEGTLHVKLFEEMKIQLQQLEAKYQTKCSELDAALQLLGSLRTQERVDLTPLPSSRGVLFAQTQTPESLNSAMSMSLSGQTFADMTGGHVSPSKHIPSQSEVQELIRSAETILRDLGKDLVLPLPVTGMTAIPFTKSFSSLNVILLDSLQRSENFKYLIKKYQMIRNNVKSELSKLLHYVRHYLNHDTSKEHATTIRQLRGTIQQQKEEISRKQKQFQFLKDSKLQDNQIFQQEIKALQDTVKQLQRQCTTKDAVIRDLKLKNENLHHQQQHITFSPPSSDVMNSTIIATPGVVSTPTSTKRKKSVPATRSSVQFTNDVSTIQTPFPTYSSPAPLLTESAVTPSLGKNDLHDIINAVTGTPHASLSSSVSQVTPNHLLQHLTGIPVSLVKDQILSGSIAPVNTPIQSGYAQSSTSPGPATIEKRLSSLVSVALQSPKY